MAVDVIIDPLTGQIYWNDSQGTAQSIAISGNGTDLIKTVGYSLQFSAAPSGTITSGSSTTAVTGSGTNFLTLFGSGSAGSGAVLYTSQGTSIGTISTVASDTSLTLSSNASGSYSGITFRYSPPAGTDRLIFSDSATPIYPATTGANLGTSSYRWSLYASSGDITNSGTTSINLMLDKSGISSTESPALQFINTTAATSGAQYQFAPWTEFRGKAWNTTSSASNDVRMRVGMAALSGTAPTSEFVIASSVDTGTASWYYPLTLNATANDSVMYLNNGVLSIGKLLISGTTSSYALELYNYNLATSGQTANWSPAFEMNGSAWNTSTATSNILRFRSEVQTTSGNPITGSIVWKSAVATSYSATPSFSNRMSLSDTNGLGIWNADTAASYFKAGSQTSDLKYTLPTSAPSTNQVLSASAVSGSDITLSWATASGSGTVNSGASGKIAYYPSAGTILDDATALDYSASSIHLTITSQGTNVVPLKLTGIASQSVDLFQVATSGGNVVSVGTTGIVTISNSTAASGTTSGALIVTGGIGAGSTSYLSSLYVTGTNLIATSATTLTLGTTASGTATVQNPTFTFSGTTLNQSAVTTYNLSTTPTGAVTLNIGTGAVAGATKTINIGTGGSGTGTTAINIGTTSGTSNLTINSTTTTFTANSATISASTSGTLTLFNTNVSAVNAFGAVTTITLGISSGTFTLESGGATTLELFNTATATTASAFTSATALTIGSSSGTATTQNATIAFPNATSFTGTSAAITAFGQSTSFTLMGTTAASTTNIATGVNASTNIKRVNVGTNGTATTLITIGTTSGTSSITLNGTLTLSSPLAIAQGGTGTSTAPTQWGVIFATSTTQLRSTAAGSTGQWLRAVTSGAPTWSTATLATTYSTGDLVYAGSDNVLSGLASTATSVLITQGAAAPSWLQGTTASRLLKTDGSAISWSQVDLADDITGTLSLDNGGLGTTTFTENGVLYGNAATSVLVTAASGEVGAILQTTTSGGAPTFSNTLAGRYTFSYSPTTGTSTNNLFSITGVPFAQASGALIEIGAATAFDGSTSNHFGTVASANGTYHAIWAASGYSGNYAMWGQADGNGSRFSIGKDGVSFRSSFSFGFSINNYANQNILVVDTSSGRLGVNIPASYPFDLRESEGGNANTSSVVVVQNITRRTSGTAAAGIGAGIQFTLENSAGSDVASSRIDGILSDVGASYLGALVFNTNTAGSTTMNERVRIDNTGMSISPIGTSAGNTGELRFKELAASGSNFTSFKAPDTLSADIVYTLPSTGPSTNQILAATAVSGTSVTLGWAADATGSGGSGTVGSGTATQLAYYSGTTTTASAPSLVYSASGTHLTITAQGASTSPLKLVGAASQSAALFTVTDSTPTTKFEISSTGIITTGTWNGSSIAVAYGGTNTTSFTGGTLIAANSAATSLVSIANGATGKWLYSTGTATTNTPAWSTATLATTFAAGDIVYASSANTLTALTTTATSVLITQGAAAPSWLQGATANRILKTSGSAISWSQVTLTTDVTGTLPIANGGTNTTSFSTTSGIVYYDGSKLVTTNSTASGILVTNASNVPSTATDIPTAVTIGGSYVYRAGGTDVPLTDGGTNASLTAVNGGIVYSTASAMAISTAGSSGQPLLSGGAGAPSFGTLGMGAGGTGLTTTTPGANYVLGMNASNNGLEYKQLVQGSNITITHAANSVTITASGGSATPGGSNTQIQYNAAGALGGISNFTFVSPLLSVTNATNFGTTSTAGLELKYSTAAGTTTVNNNSPAMDFIGRIYASAADRHARIRQEIQTTAATPAHAMVWSSSYDTGTASYTKVLSLHSVDGLGFWNYAGTPGSFANYFKTGNQASDIKYTWPTTAPTTNQVLSASAVSGSDITLSWATASGGGSGTVNTGASGKIAYYPSAGTTVDDAAALDYATTGTHLTITAQGATTSPLKVVGAASQSAALFTVATSGADVFVVGSTGNISTGTWQGTTIGVAYGGTGQTTYTDGQLLIGNSTGNTLTKATLTAGDGIGVTNGSGSITVRTKRVMNIQLASGFNPPVGADTAVIRIPESPTDGSTSVTYNVRRLTCRVETPSSGTSTFQVEYYTGTSAFSATNLLSSALSVTGASTYEFSSTGFSTSTLATGAKIRLNFSAVDTTHANFSINLLLEEN